MRLSVLLIKCISLTPNSGSFDEIVIVRVGTLDQTKQKDFKLHQGVLKFCSGYFRGALNGQFAEVKDGMVELPTEDLTVFESFVGWLYTRQLPGAASADISLHDLFELWMLADRREVPMLMNTTLDAIRDQWFTHTGTLSAELHNLYANTTEKSGLRRLVVDLIAHLSDPSKIMTTAGKDGSWPEQAVWDVLRVVWSLQHTGRRAMSRYDVIAMDMCQYHCHEKGVRCARSSTKP